jgi:aspartyl protease family protein
MRNGRMLKYTIMFGSLIGIAMAVPAAYQANPEMLRSLFSSSGETQEAQVSYVAPQAPRPHQRSSGSRVLVPMDSRGHFVTEFKFNGQKVKALVDTGATYVALNRTTAMRIGIPIKASDMRYSVSTANGEALAAAVNIEDVTIGKIRVSNVPALVLEDKALDGVLLGMSFLKELDRFSIEDRTLVLEE